MFGRKKKNDTDENNIYFIKALGNKKIPLLILDSKWHALFPDYRKTGEIKRLEKELNVLVKKQGQVTHDIKDYENAKKVLVDNIVNNMTDGHEKDSALRGKKQDMNQKLIEKLNDKIVEAQVLEEQLPKLIKQKNKELLVACMGVCYEELTSNTEEIERLDEAVRAMREELKNQILAKQDMEMRNTELYTYMHNLLGAEVVNVFDRKHKVWRGSIDDNRNNEK